MRQLIDRAIGLEKDDGEDIGRDPREMTNEELTNLGHVKMPVLDAIRARCLDCSSQQQSEVRKCTAVQCPSWPYRMGTNPWREKKELTEERREQLKNIMANARKAKN